MRLSFLTLLAFVATTLPAMAETVTAKVDGMVCAFCAKGIEDKLKQNPTVQKVSVSLDDATVSATTAKPGELTDTEMEKAITYMGFTSKGITRSK